MRALILGFLMLVGLRASGTEWTLVDRPAFNLIGISCRTSNAEAMQTIPLLWKRFHEEALYTQIPHKCSDEVIGLYCDYESDCNGSYTLLIGCPVSSLEKIPEGMVGRAVPHSVYALFRAVGEHPQAVVETWNQIWQTKLPRTYCGDFELYGDKFLKQPREVEVYVSILCD